MRLRRALLALALSSPFWGLGHALWEIDDARYAEIPREMAESGDWLTPTLASTDYVEKPPLIYWMGAASLRVFGAGEAAARLPLALAALAGVAGIWWLGAWLFSPATGVAAALILSTTLQYATLSHLITPDMTLCAALTWATALILRCMKRPRDARWAAPAAWSAAALAFLAKGPVGLLLPALWACLLAALFPALRAGAKRLLSPAGALLFAALVGPWFAAMSLAHEGFLRFFFLEQNFVRYLTPHFNRGGPLPYFLVVQAVGSLPWSAAALTAVVLPLAAWRRAGESERQLALWVAGILLFFSLSQSKLPTYILPLFPQQALLTAALLARIEMGSALERRLRDASLCVSVALAAAAAAALALKPEGLSWAAAGAFSAAAVLLAVSAAALGLRRPLPWVCGPVLAAFACALWGAGRAEELLSIRPLAASGPAFGRTLAYNAYPQGLPFYTGTRADFVNWVGEFSYAKKLPRFRRRFGDDDLVRALPEPGRLSRAVLPARELSNLVSLVPLSEIRSVRRAGAWTEVGIGGPR